MIKTKNINKLATTKPVKLLFYEERPSMTASWIKPHKAVLECLGFDIGWIHVSVQVDDYSYHVFNEGSRWATRSAMDRACGPPDFEIDVGVTKYSLDFIMGYTSAYNLRSIELRVWCWLALLLLIYFCTGGMYRRVGFYDKRDCGVRAKQFLNDLVEDTPTFTAELPHELYKEVIAWQSQC